MKTRLLLLMMLFSLRGYSQNVKFPINGQNEVEYSLTDSSTLSKDEMFSNLQTWVAETFGNYKAVVQLEDKASGKMMIGGQSEISYNWFYKRIRYKILVQLKDNKYRLTVNAIEAASSSHDMTYYWWPVRIINPELTEYKAAVDSLTAVYKSKPKKKIKAQIDDKRKQIETDVSLVRQTNQTINEILSSLSKSLKKKNTF